MFSAVPSHVPSWPSPEDSEGSQESVLFIPSPVDPAGMRTRQVAQAKAYFFFFFFFSLFFKSLDVPRL